MSLERRGLIDLDVIEEGLTGPDNQQDMVWEERERVNIESGDLRSNPASHYKTLLA